MRCDHLESLKTKGKSSRDELSFGGFWKSRVFSKFATFSDEVEELSAESFRKLFILFVLVEGMIKMQKTASKKLTWKSQSTKSKKVSREKSLLDQVPKLESCLEKKLQKLLHSSFLHKYWE